MVCEGCVDTVKKAIAKTDSSAQVNIVLETKAVTVETGSSEQEIHGAVTAAGHTVA